MSVEHLLTVPIVIGLANPMRESWVLAGFQPANENEQQRHAELCSELLDPRREAHQLTATSEQAIRKAKRVLRYLTEEDRLGVLTEPRSPVVHSRGSPVKLISSILLLLPLALAPAATAQEVNVDLVLVKKTFTDAQGKTLPYRFLAPEKIEPGQTYPLGVFLHGAGERGNDNTKQLIHGVREFAKPENRKDHPCFLIAPQCPEGSRWVEVDWGAASHTMPQTPSEPARLTLELIESLRKDLPIDSKRIYVTGLSMGGFGTWDLLARRPSLFAAAVPICGGADEATAASIATVPIWVFHGDKDGAVQVQRSRNMVAALKKAKGEPKYTEYAGVGHDSWTETYKNPELFKWLFAQTRD